MVDRERLLERARVNPACLRFAEACRLAEHFGWEYVRQCGSHRLYRRTGSRTLINLQDVNGMAKPYQVRQLLRAIDGLDDS